MLDPLHSPADLETVLALSDTEFSYFSGDDREAFFSPYRAVEERQGALRALSRSIGSIKRWARGYAVMLVAGSSIDYYAFSRLSGREIAGTIVMVGGAVILATIIDGAAAVYNARRSYVRQREELASEVRRLESLPETQPSRLLYERFHLPHESASSAMPDQLEQVIYAGLMHRLWEIMRGQSE